MTVARLGTVEEAIAGVAAGRVVVVVDEADRENEGDLIGAAQSVTTETMGSSSGTRPARSASRWRRSAPRRSGCL